MTKDVPVLQGQPCKAADTLASGFLTFNQGSYQPMSEQKPGLSSFITRVAKRVGVAFWEDLRRVANVLMAFGMYAPVVYPDRWSTMILMLLWALFLWGFAFRMEQRSKS